MPSPTRRRSQSQSSLIGKLRLQRQKGDEVGQRRLSFDSRKQSETFRSDEK
jgi:hypothetical protein